jgi:hypothetical protein
MLLRLRLVFARTTPGPWRTYQDGVHPREIGGIGSGEDYAICTHGPKSYPNGTWIEAAHNEWPMIDQLIDELCQRLAAPSEPPGAFIELK